MRRIRFTYPQMIALGFMAVILIGTALLLLPASSRERTGTDFLTCLFTATSATCVTGLAVVDTYGHWSGFGQTVILALIQTGGLGFMTVITMFFFLAKKNISLAERKLLMQSAGNPQLSGAVRLIRWVLLGTLFFELLGWALLTVRFMDDMPFKTALWYGLFHSVSAFCNAGFDLMSRFGSVSFSAYAGDPCVNFTLMTLIAVGGLGFFVWSDLWKKRFRFRKLELHSKLVLVTTAWLILSGWALFMVLEDGAAFAGMTAGERALAALFQSVTTRTAGFFTVDQASLSDAGAVLSSALMFIGGSPGSTAGGVKTTTILVTLAGALACARNTDSVVLFRKRLPAETVRQAAAIGCIYLVAVITSVCALCACDGVTLREALFEVVSAIGTVGLSMNLTPTLGAASRILLIILMYAGRIGGLTLVVALTEKRARAPLERPTERILIG